MNGHRVEGQQAHQKKPAAKPKTVLPTETTHFTGKEQFEDLKAIYKAHEEKAYIATSNVITLLETYKAFTKLFEEPKEYTLPPYRKHDHRIPLKKGKDPICKKIYAMSEKESQALRQYINEELNKGNI